MTSAVMCGRHDHALLKQVIALKLQGQVAEDILQEAGETAEMQDRTA